MGMDVFGKAPTNETGKYFRRNVWGWHPLADLCSDLAPEICKGCKEWHTNDGDGLGKRASQKLAKVLKEKLADGSIAAYVEARRVSLAALQKQPCPFCKGTGKNPQPLAKDSGQRVEMLVVSLLNAAASEKTGVCGVCEGTGHMRPMENGYQVDAEDVAEFAAFLEACGGFEIC